MIQLDIFVVGTRSQLDNGGPSLQWGWILRVQDHEIARSEDLFDDPLNAWKDGSAGVERMLAALVTPTGTVG